MWCHRRQCIPQQDRTFMLLKSCRLPTHLPRKLQRNLPWKGLLVTYLRGSVFSTVHHLASAVPVRSVFRVSTRSRPPVHFTLCHYKLFPAVPTNCTEIGFLRMNKTHALLKQYSTLVTSIVSTYARSTARCGFLLRIRGARAAVPKRALLCLGITNILCFPSPSARGKT